MLCSAVSSIGRVMLQPDGVAARVIVITPSATVIKRQTGSH